MSRRPIARTILSLTLCIALVASVFSVTLSFTGNNHFLNSAEAAIPQIQVVGAWGSAGNGPGQFALNGHVSGIGFDPSGDYLYVSDEGNHRVHKYQLASPCPGGTTQVMSGVCFVENLGGCHNSESGACDTSDGSLDGPRGVAVGPSGMVYVVDTGDIFHRRVQMFDTEGDPAGSFGTLGPGDGEFGLPRDITVDKTGRVYVTDFRDRDPSLSRVEIFDEAGTFLAKFGSVCNGQPDRPGLPPAFPCNTEYPGAVENGDGQFARPGSVEIDSQGNVFVSDGFLFNDPFFTRVQKFRADDLDFVGKIKNAVDTSTTAPEITDIALDLGGHIYVGDYWGQKIQVWSSGFTKLLNVGPIVPGGIAISPDSTKMFVVDQGGKRVVQFSIAQDICEPDNTSSAAAILAPLLTPAFAQVPQACDLELMQVMPVQAAENITPDLLVKGKNTLFKITVDNKFPGGRTVDVKYEYSGYDTQGNQKAFSFSEQITFSKGVTAKYLPQGTFVKPSEDTFTATVEINPESTLGGRITESDYTNNKKDTQIPTIETKDLKLIFVPIRFTGVAIPTPTQADARALALKGIESVNAMYPTKQATSQVSPVAVAYAAPASGTFTDADVITFMRRIGSTSLTPSLSQFNGKIHFFAVVDPALYPLTPYPGVWGLTHRGQMREASVIAPGAPVVTTPHELGHAFGLRDINEFPAKGYWVDKRLPITTSALDFMAASAPPGGTATDNWIRVNTFDFIANKLKVGALDPAVIAVSGMLFKNGELDLDPWHRLEGFYDLPLDNPGEITISYLDSGDMLLAQTGFDVNFTDPYGIDLNQEVDFASFSFNIPDVDNVAKIVISNGTEVLGERLVSANVPSVELVAPNGGEVISPGGVVNVEWTAIDPDSEAASLVFSLFISLDDGENWFPAALGLTDNSYDLEIPSSINSNKVRIMVVASDGINTSSDTSDGVFSIADSTPPTVTGTPDRQPDSSNGQWYNHAVTFTWSGDDGASGSGIASCDDPTTYSGPDGADLSLTGHCVDNAANSGTGTVNFSYDSTAPQISTSQNGQTFTQGSQVAIDATCTDLTSGISSCEKPSAVDTTTVGSKSYLVKAKDNAGNSATLSVQYTVTVDARDNSGITLNTIANTPWGNVIKVTGTLKDSTTKKLISGATITFSGNGAGGLSSVVTNSKGVFTATGLAPSSVANGWQVIAKYAGDSVHKPVSSNTGTYNTLKHTVSLTLTISPSQVKSGASYSVSGQLVDVSMANQPIAQAQIIFLTPSQIVIPAATTAIDGSYTVSGLTAPAKGNYSIKASFAGDQLYLATTSTAKTLRVS